MIQKNFRFLFATLGFTFLIASCLKNPKSNPSTSPSISFNLQGVDNPNTLDYRQSFLVLVYSPKDVRVLNLEEFGKHKSKLKPGEVTLYASLRDHSGNTIAETQWDNASCSPQKQILENGTTSQVSMRLCSITKDSTANFELQSGLDLNFQVLTPSATEEIEWVVSHYELVNELIKVKAALIDGKIENLQDLKRKYENKTIEIFNFESSRYNIEGIVHFDLPGIEMHCDQRQVETSHRFKGLHGSLRQIFRLRGKVESLDWSDRWQNLSLKISKCLLFQPVFQ